MQSCPKCGGAVANNICTACGANLLVELEIGAFQAPHIKRARIMLVLLGILYAYVGLANYGSIDRFKTMIDQMGAEGSNPVIEQFRHQVQLAYIIVVAVLVAGVANIVLAAIAGTKTMLAFNIAVGIFAVITALQTYASGGANFTNVVWWINAIILGMGYQAARKAERLRSGA